MTEFKRMEFNPNGDEELSTKIQNRLFEMGYTWRFGESKKKVKYINKEYLVTYGEGYIGYSDKQANEIEHLNGWHYEPTTLEDIMEKEQKFKAMKILINHNEELAREVQTELFRLGCKWSFHGEEYFWVGSMFFIVVEDNGIMFQGNDCHSFEEKEAQVVTLKELKEMNNKGKDEYNINCYDAIKGIIEDYKNFEEPSRRDVYLTKYENRIVWICKLDDSYHSDFELFNNFGRMFKEYKPEPKLITWYEADKVYLVDAGIVVEAEYMGKSKEAVIKFIDACSTSDFEVLNWKEKQLPEDPKEWKHD